MPNVLFGYAFGREALLKSRGHAPAINLIEFRSGLYCSGFALHDEAGSFLTPIRHLHRTPMFLVVAGNYIP